MEHAATGLVLYTGDVPDPETAGTADEYLRDLHEGGAGWPNVDGPAAPMTTPPEPRPAPDA